MTIKELHEHLFCLREKGQKPYIKGGKAGRGIKIEFE